jgi:virginiamycin B lyase
MNLILNDPLQIPPRVKRLTDDQYEKLMPEGKGRHEIASHCTDCHSLLTVVSARKTREKWREAVDRMYDDLIGRLQPLWLAMKEDEELENIIVDYLATNFAPDSPMDPRVAERLPFGVGGPAHLNRNLAGTPMKGTAPNYVAMEYSLSPGSMPRDISADAQGIAWVSERNTGMLGRFDPDTLTYTRTALSPAKESKARIDAVAVDPRGQVWLVDDGPNARIVQYNPKSREFTSYPIPQYPFLVPDIGPARIATLRFSDGAVWATRLTAQRILRLDTRSGNVTEFPVPRGSSPYGLAIDPEHMIWYAAEFGNAVVRLDPNTSRLTPHDLPTPRSGLKGMAADTEGNLWGAATESGKLIKVDYRTGKVTEYQPPTLDSGPYSVDVDTKQNLVWFSEIYADRIARFDRRSNRFVEFPAPGADSDVRRIEVDRSRPNRIWWSGASSNKIGYIEVIP